MRERQIEGPRQREKGRWGGEERTHIHVQKERERDRHTNRQREGCNLCVAHKPVSM